jgi:hypothetical protein
VIAVLRHLLARPGRLWRELGFVDAFCESQRWYADTFSRSTRADHPDDREQRTGLL